MNLLFPNGFLWGAATSSHQVEGNTINQWSEWELSEKRVCDLESRGLIKKNGLQNYISGKACDHYNSFKEDFKLAKILGHNAHRFSIEWSRVESEKGAFNEKEIKHYKEVIKTLRKLGIEPFVTLCHFTLPLWLEREGGWKSKNAPEYFARYAEKMASALGKNVQFWITINEPLIYASMSYLNGKWPPQKKNPFIFLDVIKNLIAGHKKAYEKIKERYPKSSVGIAKNNIYFEASPGFINTITKKCADLLWNFYFLNKIKKYQDFIGLNYYFHNKINYGFNKNENKIISDIGWELFPEGIYYCLKDLKKYNKPIYITENGLADVKDKHRVWFIEETLKNIYKAIQENVDARGYLHWSLMDNFEWADGFLPCFGLVKIDYKTQKRSPRPSALFYKNIIKQNGLPNLSTYDVNRLKKARKVKNSK